MKFIDKLRSRSRVYMLVSVAGEGLDLQAGESYSLDSEAADKLILKGYARGEIAREYSAEERSEIHSGHQTVGV